MLTVVRLSKDADFKRACELARITPSEVNTIQRIGDHTPKQDVEGDFRIISFDGEQMTISERVDGERSVRGFSIKEQGTADSKKQSQEIKP